MSVAGTRTAPPILAPLSAACARAANDDNPASNTRATPSVFFFTVNLLVSSCVTPRDLPVLVDVEPGLPSSRLAEQALDFGPPSGVERPGRELGSMVNLHPWPNRSRAPKQRTASSTSPSDWFRST